MNDPITYNTFRQSSSVYCIPAGVGGELFFQKHIESLQITGIKELDRALWPGHTSLQIGRASCRERV